MIGREILGRTLDDLALAASRDPVNDPGEAMLIAVGLAGDQDRRTGDRGDDDVARRWRVAQRADHMLVRGAEEVDQLGVALAHRIVERQEAVRQGAGDEGLARPEVEPALALALEERAVLAEVGGP